MKTVKIDDAVMLLLQGHLAVRTVRLFTVLFGLGGNHQSLRFVVTLT